MDPLPRDTEIRVIINGLDGKRHVETMGPLDIPKPSGASKPAQTYLVEPQNLKDYADDYTGFVPGQEHLSFHNLPFCMSMLNRPLATGPTQQPTVRAEPDRWGGQYRFFPGILPERISGKVEGWRVIYWRTLGAPYDLGLRDIFARYSPSLFEKGAPLEAFARPPRGWEKLRNNLCMREQRYRKKWGVPLLKNQEYPKQALPRIHDLSPEQARHDNIWDLVRNKDKTLYTGKDSRHYIQQPKNPYKCWFELPEGLPLADLPRTFTTAKLKIGKLRDVWFKLTEAEKKEKKWHNWWDVVLAGDTDHKKKRKRNNDDAAAPDSSNGSPVGSSQPTPQHTSTTQTSRKTRAKRRRIIDDDEEDDAPSPSQPTQALSGSAQVDEDDGGDDHSISDNVSEAHSDDGEYSSASDTQQPAPPTAPSGGHRGVVLEPFTIGYVQSRPTSTNYNGNPYGGYHGNGLVFQNPMVGDSYILGSSDNDLMGLTAGGQAIPGTTMAFPHRPATGTSAPQSQQGGWPNPQPAAAVTRAPMYREMSADEMRQLFESLLEKVGEGETIPDEAFTGFFKKVE